MISRISANGWIVPRDINPATYQPEKINHNEVNDFGFTFNS